MLRVVALVLATLAAFAVADDGGGCTPVAEILTTRPTDAGVRAPGVFTDTTNVGALHARGVFGDGVMLSFAEGGLDFNHGLIRDAGPPLVVSSPCDDCYRSTCAPECVGCFNGSTFDVADGTALGCTPPTGGSGFKVQSYWQSSDCFENDPALAYPHGTAAVSRAVGRAFDCPALAPYGGVAQNSTFYFQDIGIDSVNFVIGTYASLAWGYANGARIFSASIQYADARFGDVIDAFLAAHEDAIYIAPAGNDGAMGAGSVGVPGNARNVLTVGATMSDVASVTAAYAVVGQGVDVPADTAPFAFDTVAWYSGRGPTADGRIRPDVVAPGSWVLTARAVSTDRTHCPPAAPTDACEASNRTLALVSGTSFAAPHVAGVASLLRQLYPKSSSALIKALIISSAVPMRSLAAVHIVNGAPVISSTLIDSLPLDDQAGVGGYGLVDAGAAGDPTLKRYDVDAGHALPANYSDEYTFEALENTHVNATLVFTVNPSSVSDLDLSITCAHAVAPIALGNDGMPGITVPDRVNNVERTAIFVGALSTTATLCTVRVHCFRCAAPQSYALVVAHVARPTVQREADAAPGALRQAGARSAVENDASAPRRVRRRDVERHGGTETPAGSARPVHCRDVIISGTLRRICGDAPAWANYAALGLLVLFLAGAAATVVRACCARRARRLVGRSAAWHFE